MKTKHIPERGCYNCRLHCVNHKVCDSEYPCKQGMEWRPIIEVDNSTEPEISDAMIEKQFPVNPTNVDYKFPNQDTRNHHIRYGIEWYRSQLQPGKLQEKETKAVYTLNCDKCGTPFYSEDAFPTNHLCVKCYVSKQEVHPEVNDAYYDRTKLFERQPAKQKQSELATQPEVSAEESLIMDLLNKYTTTSLRWMETMQQNFCIDPMDYHKIADEYAALKGK